MACGSCSRTRLFAAVVPFVVLVLVMLLSSPGLLIRQAPVETAEGRALARWLVSHGGFLGAAVLQPRGKPRGLYAVQDYADDEVIGFIPHAAVVPVSPDALVHDSAELAVRVFDPASKYSLSGGWAPFWAMQPPLHELVCIETLTEEQARQLECPPLEREVLRRRTVHLENYGELREQRPDLDVTWEQWIWLESLVVRLSAGLLCERCAVSSSNAPARSALELTCSAMRTTRRLARA